MYLICDKENEMKFISNLCIVINVKIGEVILVTKRCQNMYITYLYSIYGEDLKCLSVIGNDDELHHRMLRQESFSLINKLMSKELIRGLPTIVFEECKVCDESVKEKQVFCSFKSKKVSIFSRPLDLLHMDLCGPMRNPSRGGKKYIFVIVDDYSKYTLTLFLRRTDKTI